MKPQKKKKTRLSKYTKIVGDFVVHPAAWIKALGTKITDIRYGIAVLLVACAIGLIVSGMGTYLNKYFFYNPVAKLRAKTGLLPQMDERVSLVLVEDRSLHKIGRFPTYADWQGMAKLLYEAGVEKVFLLGIHNLSSEVGELSLNENEGSIYVGSATLDRRHANNLRAVPIDKIPAQLLVPAAPGAEPPKKSIDLLITQHQSTLPFARGIGHLNGASNSSFDVAYGTKKDHVLVGLPLMMKDSLTWTSDGLMAGSVLIPRSYDDTLKVDLADPRTIMRRALPVHAFYAKDGSLMKSLTKTVKKRLLGVRYVAFVKEAYQGSRFVDSPFGKVPSYYNIVSAMNNVLQDRYQYEPVKPLWIIAAAVPIFWLLLTRSTASVALMGTIGVLLLEMVAGVISLIWFGWIFPCASVLALGLSGWIVRFIHYTFNIVGEKMMLNRDLEMGKTVQSLFIPGNLTGKVYGWEFKFIFQPYGAMSGDWVHVYQSPSTLEKPFAVFAIGDVVGKGPSAALNTAVIAGVWNQFTQKWDQGEFDMKAFLYELNRVIKRTFKQHQNTTISIGYVCEDELQLTCCGAPTWIRATPGESASSVRSKPYDPIGMQADENEVKAVTVIPKQGEVFVAHTDGVMEGSKVRKTFIKAMMSFQGSGTEQIFEGIEDLSREIGQDEVLPDDFTMVMIRRDDRAGVYGEALKPVEDKEEKAA